MSEVPLFPWWLQLTFAVWAAVGPLSGLVVGHWLTRSWDRKKWLLDTEKQEYRELLDALSAAYLALAKTELLPTGYVRLTPDTSEAEDTAYRLLNDRIYIASKLKSANIYDRWTGACKRFTGRQDKFAEFEEKYRALHDTIVQLATGSNR